MLLALPTFLGGVLCIDILNSSIKNKDSRCLVVCNNKTINLKNVVKITDLYIKQPTIFIEEFKKTMAGEW